MTPDDLLTWISAKGQGSWPQFRRFVTSVLNGTNDSEEEEKEEEDRGNLGYSQSLLLRDNFSRLGHCEFGLFEEKYGWRVVPPVLASSESDGAAFGVLCGARTPKLFETISTNCAKDEITVRGQEDAPAAMVVEAGSWHRLAEIAERSGIIFQRHAPLSILLTYPDIQNGDWEQSAEMLAGDAWQASRFDATSMTWSKTSPQEMADISSGLFRIQTFNPNKYFEKTEGGLTDLPREIGIYRALAQARRTVINYDEQTQVLSLPASCRPPVCVERALILCSGSLPDVRKLPGQVRRVSYHSIPLACAEQVSAILGQRFK